MFRAENKYRECYMAKDLALINRMLFLKREFLLIT